MKKIKLISNLVFLIFICNNGFSQSSNGTAVQLAHNIANKMKDTLSLIENQKQNIYNINMQLHDQKQAMRAAHSSNPTVMATKIQEVEKTRDSLYSTILSSSQYIMYKVKKRNLISNN
jgi:protein subunit release factor B